MLLPPGRGGSGSSRLRSASMISSNMTAARAPGGWRRPGADATAQASDAQDERMARFSWRVRSGSFTTSRGWSKADAGCSNALRSRSKSSCEQSPGSCMVVLRVSFQGWTKNRIRKASRRFKRGLKIFCAARAAAQTRGAGPLPKLCALVTIVQEFRELLAQGFVALAAMADDDRMLEQLFLHVARQLRPKMNRRAAEQRCEMCFVVHGKPRWTG